ncbi:hypothetical protein DH09_01170 (plasmid) [Bacillaceae bacterium JMAK1]|nr:hypothetical protein DH09_01170 [Bacillaceae bacterium JMAK1]
MSIQSLVQKFGKSANTIRKYLTILEDHSFIMVFHRFDKHSENKATSPLIKVRRYIPFISSEDFMKLPDKIKNEHDKFLQVLHKGTDLQNKTSTEILNTHTKFDSTSVNIVENHKSLLVGQMKRRRLLDQENVKSDYKYVFETSLWMKRT